MTRCRLLDTLIELYRFYELILSSTCSFQVRLDVDQLYGLMSASGSLIFSPNLPSFFFRLNPLVCMHKNGIS